MKCKMLGRDVKNFDSKKWDLCRVQIVFDANIAKFEQNYDLRKILFATKNAILVESSPEDTVWGIGMSEDDPSQEE